MRWTSKVFRVVPFLHHFCIIFITCYCPKYASHVCRLMLSNQQSIAYSCEYYNILFLYSGSPSGIYNFLWVMCISCLTTPGMHFTVPIHESSLLLSLYDWCYGSCQTYFRMCTIFKMKKIMDWGTTVKPQFHFLMYSQNFFLSRIQKNRFNVCLFVCLFDGV